MIFEKCLILFVFNISIVYIKTVWTNLFDEFLYSEKCFSNKENIIIYCRMEMYK